MAMTTRPLLLSLGDSRAGRPSDLLIPCGGAVRAHCSSSSIATVGRSCEVARRGARPPLHTISMHPGSTCMRR
jgi:hypothetical protein